MSTEDNKAIVRRYREIHNKGTLDKLGEVVAKDLIQHSGLPGMPPGIEGGKAAHSFFISAFPDTQVTTEDLIADGDKVVERYTARGTHKGEFMGAPATGKKYEIGGYAMYRIANGKIVEHWGLDDGTGLFTQLGLMAAPGQPAK